MHSPCPPASDNTNLPHLAAVAHLAARPGQPEGGRRFGDGTGRLRDEVPSSAGGGHRSSAVRERRARPITPAAHPCLRRGPARQGADGYLAGYLRAALQG